MHRILLDSYQPGSRRIVVEGDEARHALRVKRVRPGGRVDVLDGRGTVARCEVAETGRSLVLDVTEERHHEPVRPRVDVWSASPKGARLERMIDALVQVGAASWTPMGTELGVVEPGAGKRSRIERIAGEALKQCGRPWAMELHPRRPFTDAPGAGDEAPAIVIADARGEAWRPAGAAHVRLLIGPEGGFTQRELDSVREHGATIARFGPHAMRIEVAAPVCAGMIIGAGGA